MSTTLITRIAKYNEKTNKYDELCLYRKRLETEKYKYQADGTVIEITDPYITAFIESGPAEMLDGMENGDDIDGYGVFPWYPIRMNSLEDSLKKDIEKVKELTGYTNFHEISLSEMSSYILLHPKVADYEASDVDWTLYRNKKGPRPEKDNPIIQLYNSIYHYINFADWTFFENLSDYKIIFYFCY